MRSIRHICFIPLILCAHACLAQTNSSQDERRWWDLLHYDISIAPDYNKKFISGTNSIRFRALQTAKRMQIDLMEPMIIDSIKWNKSSLKFHRDGDAFFVEFPENIQKGSIETITISFSGNPQVATRPPWTNGWIWASDKKRRPWMSVTCEGSGAAVWLPCKNMLYDEPDSGMTMRITVPDSLIAVSNGRLLQKLDHEDGTATYTWAVVNPINHYNIIPYIGKYVSWHEDYKGEKGKLDCDYWVLDYNLIQAKRHFKQVDTMLNCFEYWMGPYPFYEDSYKLVEAPHPGMEHQSAIAYGNGFSNGYNGKDIISGTGWGLKWDFILVHESGHEWFGNNITSGREDAESWVHEGFTKYLETIYTTWVCGKEAGNDYCIGTWKRIRNDEPPIGSGSSDNYYKASAMLHAIRQIVGDSAFREMLRGLNKTFYHQTVSTEQILGFVNQSTGQDFTAVFNQYLRTTKVPVLEYAFRKGYLAYRWTNCVQGFNMPVKISLNHQDYAFIHPTAQWQQQRFAGEKTITIDRNFYVQLKESQ